MTESTDMNSPSPVEILCTILEEEGATDVLGEALQVAGLDSPPETREELVHFLEGPLQRALIGTLHPVSAGRVIETLRESLSVHRSGTQRKLAPAEARPDRELVLTDSMAATVPPPAGPSAAEAYDDLVSGAIHSRITPAWGIRTVDPDAEPGSTVWVIISNDSALQHLALQRAPATVDVVAASSMAVLNGALKRSESKASAVLLDAQNPSVKLDRAIAALTSDALDMRVVVWRMSPEARARLIEAIPHAATWLPCEGEVTPTELIMLLGL